MLNVLVPPIDAQVSQERRPASSASSVALTPSAHRDAVSAPSAKRSLHWCRLVSILEFRPPRANMHLLRVLIDMHAARC